MADRAQRQRSKRLQSQLKQVEEEIRSSVPPDPKLFNQAGDLRAQLGKPKDAMAAYGNAINAYIKAGQVAPAHALCMKVIRRYPNVVRAHFTLACVTLHQGLWVEAINSLKLYAAATRDTETESYAIPRLRFLAQPIADPTVREAIAELLADLDDAEGAQLVRTKPPRTPRGGLGRIFLEAATWDSDAVWATYWTE